MAIPKIIKANEPNRKVQIQCAKCQNETIHDVVFDLSQVIEEDEDSWYENNNYETLVCCGCFAVSFRSTETNLSTDHHPEGRVVPEIYPPRKVGRTIIRGAHHIPSEVSSIYQETHKALVSDQPLLAAIGIRAIVETVCKNTGATERTLPQKIEGLVSKGLISGSGAVTLKEIKVYGD